MKAALLYTTDIVLHFPFDLSSSPPPSFLLFLPYACMHTYCTYKCYIFETVVVLNLTCEVGMQ